MQPVKKRAVESPSGGRSPQVTKSGMNPERRQKLLAKINVVEEADEHIAPEFSHDGMTFNEEEDLLKIQIPEKPEDLITDPDGHRLIIHDIFVFNFKSYKGTHQLGPFHKNLTMILGPNGSGKSNIIDALLFVFGFKNKKIRTNKLTSLIHSSGDCDQCKVEVQFEVIKDLNENEYSVVAGSSFKISRIVRSDGMSQYKLNDAITKQEEITGLLKKCGIDLQHNRFLILQGEVEAIALMKPTTKSKSEPGMLEYIEDIVGTHRYVAPIAKIQHKVALLEIESSRYLAAKRRNDMLVQQFSIPMRAHVDYINSNNERLYYETMVHKSNMCSFMTQKELVEKELESMKDAMHAADEKDKEAHALLKKLEHHEARLKKNHDEVSCLRSDKALELSLFLGQLDSRRQKIKLITKSLVERNVELDKAKEDVVKAENAPDESRKQIAMMKQEVEEHKRVEEQCLKTIDDNMARFEMKSAVEKKMRDEEASTYAKLNGNTNQLQVEVSVAENDIKDMKVSAMRDEKRLDELKGALDCTLARQRHEEAEMVQAKREIEEVSRNLDEANQQLPPVLDADRDMRTRLENLKKEVEDSKHQNKQITYKHPCTQRLADLKASGKFPGFHGRLGDLGRVDKKYDPVISTVFSQMEWHVVETSNDAQFALDWIYEQGLPRTTMLQMELCQDEYDLRMMDAPPSSFPAPRLFDQIQCEDRRFRAAFYYCIRDILVVNKLIEAQKIDKKFHGKYRVCCLDTTVLDRGGNITGGGKPYTNRIRTGAVPSGTLKTRSEIQRMEAQLENMEKQHVAIDEKVTEYKATVARCTSMISALRTKIRELTYSIPKLVQCANTLRDAIKVKEDCISRGVIEFTMEDIAVKKKEIEELKKKLISVKAEATASKRKLDAHQQKIDDMFEKMVLVHKNKVAETREHINCLEASIFREEASILSAPHQLEQAKRKLQEAEERYEDKRAECEREGEYERDSELKETRNLTNAVAALELDVQQGQEAIKLIEKEKEEAAKKQKLAHDEFEKFKSDHDELCRHLDRNDANYHDAVEEIEQCLNNYMTPETSDPHVTLVRFSEENQQLIDDGDAVGIPQEVLDMIVDYKTKMNDLTNEELPEGEASRISSRCMDMAGLLEQYRRKFDEKGISQYCILMAMVNADEVDTEHNFKEVASHREKLAQLRRLRHKEFTDALTFLCTTTQLLYQMITNGGDASLKFVEEGGCSDPFDAGIKFSVRPAKKSWKLIENLSGGEKTLASLCFVFAIHHYRATPLYVMDEIDAALDLNNVRLIANYVKHSERTRNAQFIIISLRNQMFEVGSRLIGIYKTDGCTHNVVIAPDRVENGNRLPKETLYDKIKEEERKRKEAVASRENDITEGMQSVTITKRRRKLGRLCLADFGLDDNDKEEDEDCSRRLNLLELETGQGFDETEEEEEEDDEQPVKKRRVKIVDPSDEEEVSPSPTPPPRAVSTRGRRPSRASRQQASNNP